MKLFLTALLLVVFVTCVTAQNYKAELVAHEFAFTDTIDTNGDSLETKGGANMSALFSSWYTIELRTDSNLIISPDSTDFVAADAFQILAGETFKTERMDVRNYPDYYFRSGVVTSIIRVIVQGR